MHVPPQGADHERNGRCLEELRAVRELVLTAKTYVSYEAYEANFPGEAAKLDAFAGLTQEALLRWEGGGFQSPGDLSWVPRAREVCAAIVREIERHYGAENLSSQPKAEV